MKFCRLLLIYLFVFFLPAGLFAQNLFSEKMDICTNTEYCMDCGNPKATVSAFTLEDISYRINRRYSFSGNFSELMFQVLVDDDGFSCVLSYNDPTKSQLTWDLIRDLNGCLWKPAKVDGKPVRSSVNVVFTISNGKISGKMRRMDLSELTPPGNPTIYNKQFAYSNPSLNNYDFTVWTKYNSPLPDNISQNCAVDKKDVLWYPTAKGLTVFDGNSFAAINETNSPFTSTTVVHAIAVDKDNNTWMYANKAIYMHDNAGWRIFDSVNFKISGAYRIIANPTGELFFTNSKGLLIVRGDKLRLIDQQVLDQLPSNNVYYAYYDTQQRLWIGTSGGTIMIDKKQKSIPFNRSNTPLNNVCITNAVEDENGNIYFSLLDPKNPPGDIDAEGIAVLTKDGKWLHYNDKNSGMPSNHVNSLLYDKLEHVLWIGTHESGLVRFDLKDGWENYNNVNSGVPGFDIYQMAQDSKGNIYAATINGLLRIRKK